MGAAVNARTESSSVVCAGPQVALQSAFDNAMNSASSAAALDCLVVLAEAGETAALIALWDRVAEACPRAHPSANTRVWAAVSRLHTRHRKRADRRRGTLLTPLTTTRRLDPARRLHKICKGRRMSQRASGAQLYVAAAVAFLAAERAAGRGDRVSAAFVARGKGRIACAKRLKSVLKIESLETARGLVTTLKRKRAFK